MKDRVVFFDYLRAFVILLVVLHHSVQAYTTYAQYNPQNYVFSSWPVADAARWYGFDLFQRLQDMYFMPLLFLVSGFFTWPSLTRKGAAAFLRDRLKRLGIPFVFGIVVLAPIGEYPSYLATGHAPGFFAFLKSGFFQNDWYSGPVWFLWVLLAFSAATAVIFATLPNLLPAISRRLEALTRRPFLFVAVLLACAFAVYAVPYSMLPYTDLRSWSYWAAPFWVQINRLPLYAWIYFFGVSAGVPGIRQSRVFRKEGPLVGRWRLWGGAALTLYLAGVVSHTGHAIFLPFVCTFSCLALIGIFSKFMDRPSPFWDAFSGRAYAIYLVHFPVVVWIQYGLLSREIPVFLKFAAVALFGFWLSWIAASILRSLPGAKAIL